VLSPESYVSLWVRSLDGIMERFGKVLRTASPERGMLRL
jgi:hypothetical protein